MNTQLEKLLDKYNLSPKTRHDFIQIYALLPLVKQKDVLHNFDIMLLKIRDIEAWMKKEQEILLDNIIPDIMDIIAQKGVLNTGKETKILSTVL